MREDWNTYITDRYWPSNTSADAPEKILYFFIREALVKDSPVHRLKEPFTRNKWFEDLIKDVTFKSDNTSVTEKFKEYYTVMLQEGNSGSYGSSLPVPFHVLVPALFQPLTKNQNVMNNKGFSNRFLITFFNGESGINYDLLQKLWNVFNNLEELNYYEKMIVNAIKSKHFPTLPQLKTKEELEKYVKKWDVKKFGCKEQPELFQKDLNYVLNLENISRVEKIRWLEYVIYFHFSTYMLRIYTVIEDEFEDYEEAKDNCLNCKGIDSCVFRGKVHVKSNLSGYNKEAKIIQNEYHQLMNQTLIRGYVRFISVSRFFYIYYLVSENEAENLLQVKEYLANFSNKEKFIEILNKYLGDIVYPNIEEYSSFDKEDIYLSKDVSVKFILHHLYNLYLDYYEKKGIKSLENSTKGVFIKLAGDKMGCNYLQVKQKNNNIFQLNSEFLTFIVNVILGSEKEQMLLSEMWEDLAVRGFSPSSNREKKLIENQLSALGLLEKKSDAGESEFVKKTMN
jgi:hypothetical protein